MCLETHLCIVASADEAMTKLNNSVRATEVDPKDFVALFVPGGHGTLPPYMHTESHVLPQRSRTSHRCDVYASVAHQCL